MRIAVIPARGGSKRIPRKNIRAFAGRPILGYSIAAARECGRFDRILVSTDDEEIAAVARAEGAEVPFLRPATLADDFTGTNAVVRHAIATLEAAGAAIELACCIYATAPFVQARHLIEGCDRLSAAPASAFAFSVTSFPFPVQRAIRLAGDGVAPLWPENIGARSQDLPEAYHDAGQFYWGRARAFLDDLPIFAPHSIPIVLPRWLVQDIDTLEDWERAERMYRAWHAA